MGVGTLYGVNTTLIAAGGESQILQGMVDARLKVMVDTYVTTGSSEDIGTTIAMGPTLPAGARIIDVILAVSGSLGSNSTTLAVGDSDTANRYIAATAISADVVMHNSAKSGGVNYIIGTATGDNQILITTAGAHNTTASVNIKVIVLYAMD